jgi:hypothetical protein
VVEKESFQYSFDTTKNFLVYDYFPYLIREIFYIQRFGRERKGGERNGKDWSGMDRSGKDWSGMDRNGFNKMNEV